MPRLHIKFPMHLNVRLSENSFYYDKSSLKQENILKNVFANYVCSRGQLHSLPNKLIKKILFSNVFFKQLYFPINIGNYIICQVNFVYIQQKIICEKHLPYYIFTLPELVKCKCKTTLLKVDITPKEPIKSVKEVDL